MAAAAVGGDVEAEAVLGFGSEHKKTPLRRGAGVLDADFRSGFRNGGYGWTRTTDPSIMSAVL